MKYHIIINSVKTVDALKDAWTNEDYIVLLEKFGIEDSSESSTSELLELLFMAISDFEPEEAAAIILDHKLADQLNENQIEQISHEMLLDNQLLHKAYNGTFPNAKATVVEFEITPNKDITKEVVLKAFDKTLANNNVIKRLFSNHLAGEEAFDEAESIVWDLISVDENSYTLTTSEYWMSRDEFKDAEFDATVVEFEDEED